MSDPVSLNYEPQRPALTAHGALDAFIETERQSLARRIDALLGAPGDALTCSKLLGKLCDKTAPQSSAREISAQLAQAAGRALPSRMHYPAHALTLLHRARPDLMPAGSLGVALALFCQRAIDAQGKAELPAFATSKQREDLTRFAHDLLSLPTSLDELARGERVAPTPLHGAPRQFRSGGGALFEALLIEQARIGESQEGDMGSCKRELISLGLAQAAFGRIDFHAAGSGGAPDEPDRRPAWARIYSWARPLPSELTPHAIEREADAQTILEALARSSLLGPAERALGLLELCLTRPHKLWDLWLERFGRQFPESLNTTTPEGLSPAYHLNAAIGANRSNERTRKLIECAFERLCELGMDPTLIAPRPDPAQLAQSPRVRSLIERARLDLPPAVSEERSGVQRL